MQYKCENCRRKFVFDDDIDFCPYCGKLLFQSNSIFEDSVKDDSLARKIDAIWGDEARIRREFSSVVSNCICLINKYAEQVIEESLPEQDVTKYEKNYAAIKQSNNRKTLIARIDHYLDSLDAIINNMSNRIPMNILSKLEEAHKQGEKIVKELYDFLGFRYAPSHHDAFSEENYSTEVLYSREQLRTLYELVLIAYLKYKKCVADNNMFAAFASTSDYGALVQPWCKWLNSLNHACDDEEEQEERPKFEEAVDYMKKHNAKKYYGMLDEDFVPHVDAFWHGLEMLCEFIDNHISIDYSAANAHITQDEQDRILRNISSANFYVSNERLEGLLDLQKRFEEKMKSSNDNWEM